jgi:hypothetical protein
MDTTTFKAKIYEPYLEAWKILKLIQYADQTSDSDEQWQRYMMEIDRLRATYPDNHFVKHLIRLLYDAGDVIKEENRKT